MKVEIPLHADDVDRNVRSKVTAWIEGKRFPGCVAGQWSAGRWKWRLWAGWSVVTPARIPMAWTTVFDVASLTKPLVTAAAVLEKGWDLEAPMTLLNPGLPDAWRSISLADVLRHTAGFLDWAPIYLMVSPLMDRYKELTEDPRYRTHRTLTAVYSCLGYHWLALWLKRQGVDPRRRLVQLMVSERTAFADYNPPPGIRSRIAGTEVYRRYERELARSRGWNVGTYGWHQQPNWGAVHDLNAYTLPGRVAGNAGLFADIEGLAHLARWWLTTDAGGGFDRLEVLSDASGSFIPGWSRGFPGLMDTRGEWYYHSGFTGVCMALRPRTSDLWIFLTNRIHPLVTEVDINEIRREFFLATTS